MSKKDEDVEVTPFTSIDKSQVLQEARIFHDLQINSRKCCVLLTKILYLIYQGEIFATTEATEVFFAITKLFQSKDITLRRMVYLVIKELSGVAQDVIIVTSSLQKDMNAKADPVYRANAIRSLCKITDSSMIASMERFFKQAIVDKNPTVSSAALVSACHLFNNNKEVVKRWVNEVQEASQSKSTMVQYHALGLMYQIRQKDRMAVAKLVQSFSKGGVRSPYAHCMLIRYAVKVMEEEEGPSPGRSLYDFLDSSLRHKNEFVVFEAARAIFSLPDATSKEVIPALAVLQLFLSSPKPALRFAAIRTLNRAASTHAYIVAACNVDMENLITDANRTISTLAITTLLKTGTEASVDRLMKQIEGFMSEISDEFKVVVVEAIRSLCLKFPNKQASMINFLAYNLREEGGFEFKRAIVDTLLTFITEIPESREAAIVSLCEFIEDCEFPQLAVRILHMLGKEGPNTPNPTRCIRYIYNRVILETSTVRAAAVTALAKFGVSNLENLRASVIVLLTRCLNDNDDEVRDRATFYLNIIKKDASVAKQYLAADTIYSIAALERALANYVTDPHNAVSGPFNPQSIPKISADQEITQPIRKTAASMVEETPVSSSSLAAAAASKSDEFTIDKHAANLAKVPELAKLGTLLVSSKPIALTEAETEYNVSLIKHIFPEHIVLQYDCRNTLNDQILEDVYVQTETDADDISEEKSTKIAQLKYDDKQSAFVIYSKPADSFPQGSFTNLLKFVVKDCDPETGEADPEGYPDEYELEAADLSLADYMLPHQINNFKQAWDEMGDAGQASETFQLTAVQSLTDAVETVVSCLGMKPLEKSNVVPADKTTHTVFLSGNLKGQTIILALVRLVYNASSGVTMELSVRSDNAELSQLIANAIQ